MPAFPALLTTTTSLQSQYETNSHRTIERLNSSRPIPQNHGAETSDDYDSTASEYITRRK